MDSVIVRRSHSLSNRLQLSKLTLASGGMILALGLIAVMAPILPLENPQDHNLSQYLLPPSGEHWLGTDEFGRDMLSRVIWGARLSLLAGTLPVLLSLIVGLGLGLIAAYQGGAVEGSIMRFSDFLFSIPYFLIALIVVALLGPGLINAILAIAVGLLPSFIRLSRASALTIKKEPYVMAARALGLSSLRIIFIHMLPNTITPLIVFSTIKVGESVLAAASLSFLGLGAQPPAAEWGLMLNNARELVLSAPHAVFAPSFALSITVLAFNLLADELRDRLDPKYRY